MYTYDQVYSGLERYLEAEILKKVPGWKKWILGTGIEMAIQNGTNIFNGLKNHELVKMLNIIDENDHINVAELYKCMKKQAEHGPVDIDIPIIGTMKLNKDDVDKLYYYITE